MDAQLLFLLAYLLIAIGFIGAFLPLMPGATFIWLGVVIWAFADGFRRVGWLALGALTILLIVGWVSGFFLSTLFSRKSGASWKAIFAAIVGGLLGGIFLSELPVLGTIAGAIIGALLGMFLVEWFDKRNWRKALKASASYLVGSLTSKIVEIIISLVMLGIFVWQAFF